MKLPFFQARSSPRDSYFGLFLKENKGVGYIFQGHSGRLSVLASKEFTFSNGWENLTEDVDQILLKLENDADCRIEQAIFFLFSYMIEADRKEIKKPYLQKIKELTKNLDLKAIGYIECYEAVASYLQHKEDSPLTAILIELDDTNVDIFIYKAGQRLYNFIVARTDSIIDDLHSVFDSLKKDTLLPNRLILYNSSNLIDESTSIISHRWSPDLFIQLPRVEILKESDLVTGLLSVFESQIYQKEKKEKADNVLIEEDVMGFVINRDIAESIQTPEFEKSEESEKDTNAFTDSTQVFIDKSQKSSPFKTFIQRIRMIHFPVFSVMGLFKRKNIIAVILLLCISLLLFTGEYFFHKAEIVVTLPSKLITKKILIDAAVASQGEKSLTITVATSSVQMKDVKITTGKRDVGEKAKGEVTLYNFDDKDKVFTKGTIIQTDTLQFSINEDVKVAASTLASDASAKLPGKSKAKVTAVDIGTESNIDKGKRFKIADLSSSVFFALNDSAFSGGTKKTIKTVSKNDLDELKALLLQKARDRKRDEIFKAKDKHITIIDSLTDYQLSEMKFSREVGEEADSVTLNTNVLARYYYFETASLISSIKKAVQKDIPPGYYIAENHLRYKINEVKREDENININLSLDIKATKQIDTNDAASFLRAKKSAEVERLMENKYSVVSSTVQVRPAIPFIMTFLPFFTKNIRIQTQSQ